MLEKGYEINYIKIISDVRKRKKQDYYYECECKCGNIKWIKQHTLYTKRIRDCGCGSYMIEKHIGEKYGLFVVEKCARKRINGKINIVATCKCECGQYREIPVSNLKAGRKSCGCLQKFNFERDYKNKSYNNIKILKLLDFEKKEILCKCHCGNLFTCKLHDLTSKKNPIISCIECCDKKHYGQKYVKLFKKTQTLKSQLKNIYKKMLDRCYNTNAKDYKWYGAKNIKVCEFWKKDFNAFFDWAICNGYKSKLTIDRINYNDNYTPENCRWVDMQAQQNNRSNNVKYFYKEDYLTLPQIARAENFNLNTLKSRMRKGISLKKALAMPIKGSDKK